MGINSNACIYCEDCEKHSNIYQTTYRCKLISPYDISWIPDVYDMHPLCPWNKKCETCSIEKYFNIEGDRNEL